MRRTLTHEQRKSFIRAVNAGAKPAALARMFGVTRPTAAEYSRYIRNGGMPYSLWKRAIADVMREPIPSTPAADFSNVLTTTNDYGAFELRDTPRNPEITPISTETIAFREPRVGLIRRAWRFIW